MSTKKIIAIVLLSLQGAALLGAAMSGGMIGAGLFEWIGFFILGIIGGILLYKDHTDTKKATEHNSARATDVQTTPSSVSQQKYSIDDIADAFKHSYHTCYFKITNSSVITKCDSYKPLTAAYLYVVLDSILYNAKSKELRQNVSQKLLDFIEKELLNQSELKVFDDTVCLFAKVMNGEIPIRADWCNNNYSDVDPRTKSFICYGDLLYNSECIYNYENAPLLMKPTEETIQFKTDFVEILKILADFEKSINLYISRII